MFHNNRRNRFLNQPISPEQFSAFAEQGYTHVPVMREILADLDTPVSTFLKLANQPYSYLFESVQGGDKWGRYSIIGLPASIIYELRGFELTETVAGQVLQQQIVDDPLQTIRDLQARYRVAPIDDLPPMHGGLVGHFGYETIQYVEPRLRQEHYLDAIDCPDILLMVSEDVLVFDNVSGCMHLITLASTAQTDGLAQANQRLDALTTKLREPFAADQDVTSAETTVERDYQVHFPQADFEAAVEKCRDYIRDGDIMQVVLSQRLSTAFSGEAFDVYRALRTINPSPYMYYLHLGDYQIVGSSPEILVSVQNNSDDEAVNKQDDATPVTQKVTVRPIAGTRGRGDTLTEDQRLENELLNDPKELAEHLMLIDLGRNDVGRIAKTGSVELTEQMIIERYSHVMHIVSNVDGELLPDMDALDVLAATFPAGTVSGAPKIRVMEIIAELEPYKRGVYSGAVGYLGWQGNMDTAIAIRTAVIKDGRLFLQAGAGIVADSVPKYEWKETMSKARAMLQAVELVSSGALHGVSRHAVDASVVKASAINTNDIGEA